MNKRRKPAPPPIIDASADLWVIRGRSWARVGTLPVYSQELARQFCRDNGLTGVWLRMLMPDGTAEPREYITLKQ